MMKYSPMKHQEKNYSIPTTSIPNHHAQRIGSMSVHLFNLNTTEKLPPVSNLYVCFQINGKSTQAAKCIISGITTKVIDCVLTLIHLKKNVS